MALDHRTWMEQAKAFERLRKKGQEKGLKRTVATGGRANALMADPLWAWCVREFEEARDAARKRADAIKEKLLLPELVNSDDFNRLKNQLIEAEALARAFQQAIDTPQRAVEAKEKAEGQLRGMIGVESG